MTLESWLRRLDKNSWPRRLCRYLATPRPLTYSELLERAKARGLISQGYVYHTLGLIDCGLFTVIHDLRL